MKKVLITVAVAVMVGIFPVLSRAQGIFPDFSTGAGFTVVITATNTTLVPTYINMWVVGSDGKYGLPVQINGGRPGMAAYSWGTPVPPNGSQTFVVTSIDPDQLVTGWVAPIAVGADGKPAPAGTLVFSGTYFYAPGGVDVGQAEMRMTPPVTKFLFSATRAGGENTGLAIANPNPATAGISCKIFDEGGAVVATLNRLLPYQGQVRGFVDELVDGLPPSWTGGKVECSATLPVAAVMLKTKVNGTFTFSSGAVTPLEK